MYSGEIVLNSYPQTLEWVAHTIVLRKARMIDITQKHNDLQPHDSGQVFFFHPCGLDDLDRAASDGLTEPPLLDNLSIAQRLETEAILVIDAHALGDVRSVGSVYWTSIVPPEAIRNADPYAPPFEVLAAGGIVRHRDTDEVLCIRRLGLLDLPKGKLEANESISACAMREVQEETGIADLCQGRLLGTTVHGYHRAGRFKIKTTYWFAFTSRATQFVPAEEEAISAVCWVPEEQAARTLGYATLRSLLIKLRSVTRERGGP